MKITKTINRVNGEQTTIEADSAYELLATEKELRTGLLTKAEQITGSKVTVLGPDVRLGMDSKAAYTIGDVAVLLNLLVEANKDVERKYEEILRQRRERKEHKDCDCESHSE